MPTTLTVRSRELNELDIGEFLRALRSAGDVRLTLDVPLRLDAVGMAMVVATASRGRGKLTVDFASRSPSSSVMASVHESLLAPLIWGSSAPGPRELSRRAMLAEEPIVIDPANRTFCAHTARLALSGRLAFQADLERLCRASRIVVPGSVYGAISTIAFETASNAEEYGAFEADDSAPPTALRYLAARVHEGTPVAVSASASRYVDAYVSAGHSKPGRWLELLIVDAGVGMAYPSFHVMAVERGWPNHNVFSEPLGEEQARLNVILNSRESTKGRWGRIINSETSKGEGTRFVMLRLSAVRGYAALHTGRSKAEWWYARPERTPRDVASLPPYNVLDESQPFFGGTIWHVLVPLDTQLRLDLGPT